jgi:hypothetical protein
VIQPSRKCEVPSVLHGVDGRELGGVVGRTRERQTKTQDVTHRARTWNRTLFRPPTRSAPARVLAPMARDGRGASSRWSPSIHPTELGRIGRGAEAAKPSSPQVTQQSDLIY